MESSILTTGTMDPEERHPDDEETKSNSEEPNSSDTPLDIMITSAPGDVEDDDEDDL